MDVVLDGRARKLWFLNLSGCDCLKWVGPALCGRKALVLDDLIIAAKSYRFASRIKVEEYIHSKGTYVSRSTVVFTVMARWPEGNVEGCGGPLPDFWSRISEDLSGSLGNGVARI